MKEGNAGETRRRIYASVVSWSVAAPLLSHLHTVPVIPALPANWDICTTYGWRAMIPRYRSEQDLGLHPRLDPNLFLDRRNAWTRCHS
jgi:hypothetical protein